MRRQLSLKGKARIASEVIYKYVTIQCLYEEARNLINEAFLPCTVINFVGPNQSPYCRVLL